MSCNKHLSIAHIFEPKNGIIFALKHGKKKAIFNYNWISNYANYYENIYLVQINVWIIFMYWNNYKIFGNSVNML